MHKVQVRFLAVFIAIITVFLGVLFSTNEASATTQIKLGDYIKMGKYNGNSLVWRVIDFDEEGDPLLFAKDVICKKGFGGPEIYYSDIQATHCTNNWEKSAIRAWLNSEEAAGNVVFPYGYPYIINEDPFGDGGFPYDQEAGFLSANNFIGTEKSLIKEKTQKSLLTKIDIKDAEGGTEAYNRSVYSSLNGRKDIGCGYYGPANELIGNYDKAYYRNVTDKIFLLDVVQFQKASESLKEDWVGYYQGQLQEYFLRTPDGQGEDLVARAWCWANYHVGATDPTIDFSQPHNAEGIRPAFFLDMDKSIIAEGTGSKERPYTLKSTGSTTATSNASSIKVVIDGKNVSFNSSLGYPFVDSANRTQVPLRVTMESYGATVEWNAGAKTAVVEKGGVIVKIPVGQKYILVNNQKQAIDTVAQIAGGRTYLPIRPVVEALAGQVGWDQAAKAVIIKSQNQ